MDVRLIHRQIETTAMDVAIFVLENRTVKMGCVLLVVFLPCMIVMEMDIVLT